MYPQLGNLPLESAWGNEPLEPRQPLPGLEPWAGGKPRARLGPRAGRDSVLGDRPLAVLGQAGTRAGGGRSPGGRPGPGTKEPRGRLLAGLGPREGLASCTAVSGGAGCCLVLTSPFSNLQQARAGDGDPALLLGRGAGRLLHRPVCRDACGSLQPLGLFNPFYNHKALPVLDPQRPSPGLCPPPPRAGPRPPLPPNSPRQQAGTVCLTTWLLQHAPASGTSTSKVGDGERDPCTGTSSPPSRESWVPGRAGAGGMEPLPIGTLALLQPVLRVARSQEMALGVSQPRLGPCSKRAMEAELPSPPRWVVGTLAGRSLALSPCTTPALGTQGFALVPSHRPTPACSGARRGTSALPQTGLFPCSQPLP